MNQNHYFKQSGIGLPEYVQHLKEAGYFDRAIRIIDRMLEDPATPNCMKENLQAQREMMVRLPRQFPYSKDRALEIIRQQIPDYTLEELEEQMDNGRVTWIFIKGREHVASSFFGTLCKSAAFTARLPKNPAEEENTSHELLDRAGRLNRCMKIMREKGSMAARIRIRHTVQVKDEFFVPGETYRVFIPLPADCIQQSELEIIDCYGEPTHICAGEADACSIHWEETMTENHPFWVEYSYKHVAPYVDPASIKADPVQPDFYTGEVAPHIVFTPYVKALTAELTAGLTDPIAKARAIYDYITKNVKYSFTPDYFCMSDIADTCLRTLRGDCGVQALAFITLCRCAGIPAKWQSGQCADPDGVGMHDWAMFYVAPYGWMFADCSFGGSAFQAGAEERRNHYFGNLDIYRNVTTNTFMADFEPQSRFFRYDPYDNQRGEVEDSKRGYPRWEVRSSMEIVSLEEIEA